MYPIAIVGSNSAADLAALACSAAGFAAIKRFSPSNTYEQYLAPIPANATRLIGALASIPVDELGRIPQRAQIRLGQSGYLLSELPLGEFYRQRYGAPIVNCSAEELRSALGSESLPTDESLDAEALNRIEDAHSLTLVTERLRHRLTEPKTTPPWCWFSVSTDLAEPVGANITWLRGSQRIWQWSSKQRTHFLLMTPSSQAFDPKQWYPSLHCAIAQCTEARYFDPQLPRIREHYYDGTRVFLSSACYQPHPIAPESIWLGLEDAWVLARMLENYEEDILDGVREYQRYRQARARRTDLASARAFALVPNRSLPQRLLHNIGVALGSRFLPEIVMHKQDWFHQHDCIRGFR